MKEYLRNAVDQRAVSARRYRFIGIILVGMQIVGIVVVIVPRLSTVDV
jgi:hypothetical protein